MESSKSRLAFLLVFIISLVYLINNWFLQDDAFISFRYALNFANGHGFVFNTDERVEGYTNFLWTLVTGYGFRLNLTPEVITYSLSLICFLIAFYLFSRILENITRDRERVLIASLALFLNFSFSSYLSGGLESAFQIVLNLLLFHLVVRNEKDKNHNSYLFISIACAMLVLNRLDSLIWVAIFILYLLYDLYILEIPIPKKINRILLLFSPFILIIGAWSFWKLNYYGEILPNTFYLKIGVKPSLLKTLMRGIAFEVFFVIAYFILPLLFITFLFLKKRLRIKLVDSNKGTLIALVIVLLLYNLYFLWIGGDFMEFRFQAPLIPFYMILIFKLIETKKYSFIVSLLLVFNSFIYSFSFRSAISGFESVPYLKHHIYSKSNDWKGIGEILNSMFDETDVRIAVSPAGAIPYYSNLYSIDMLGLNNKEVAKNGLKYLDTPGHYKISSIDYLKEKNANLIIGHPWMVRKEKTEEILKGLRFESFERLLPGLKKEDVAGEELSVLEVQVNDEFNLICWYLTPHQLVEDFIQKENLKKTTIQF